MENIDIIVAKKLLQIQNSASERAIPFSLSFKKVKALLLTKTCYFSGIEFDNSEDNKKTFDRIDSLKGYSDDNVVACTQKINKRKSELSFEEIEMLYNGIIKHKKSLEKNKLKNQIWTYISGTNKRYKISSAGFVLNSITNKQLLINNGRVRIYKEGKQTRCYIKELISQHFVDKNNKVDTRQLKTLELKETPTKEYRVFKDYTKSEFVIVSENKRHYIMHPILNGIIDKASLLRKQKNEVQFVEKRII